MSAGSSAAAEGLIRVRRRAPARVRRVLPGSAGQVTRPGMRASEPILELAPPRPLRCRSAAFVVAALSLCARARGAGPPGDPHTIEGSTALPHDLELVATLDDFRAAAPATWEAAGGTNVECAFTCGVRLAQLDMPLGRWQVARRNESVAEPGANWVSIGRAARTRSSACTGAFSISRSSSAPRGSWPSTGGRTARGANVPRARGASRTGRGRSSPGLRSPPTASAY